MKRLKLIKGLSFCMMDFSCKKGEPFCVDDEKAEELLSTGRFEMLGVVGESPKTEGNGKPDKNQSLIPNDSQNPKNDNTDDGGEPGKPDDGGELTAVHIDKMKKDELIVLAAEKDIDIKDCNNNEERMEKIKEALGLVSYGSIGFEE